MIHNKYIIDERILSDLEMLFTGSFDPVYHFMNEDEYLSVIKDMKTLSGAIWPIPIVFPLSHDDYKVGDYLTLCDEFSTPIAYLLLTDIYKPHYSLECQQVYGTTDDNHPSVAYVNSVPFYAGGEIKQLQLVEHFDFCKFRLTPNQVKAIIHKKGWKNVIGFQTRNPMHRCHYELTKYALSQVGENTGLLLHPVVGPTQVDDVNYVTRVKCYKHILKYYDKSQVLLSLLPLSMKMAGPREALLHAIIRRNYGCTHFIVGRDHAGPSTKRKDGESFYGPYDAQNLLEKYQDEIGIQMVPSPMLCYVKNRDQYLPITEVNVDTDEVCNISGTELREKLKNEQDIPEWFSFPEILDELYKEYCKQGICFYFIGLSGSGKTTMAHTLKKVLSEQTSRPITILDGDVVRQNLSQGLGFSKEDRSINVRRIGYVAMEIVKHGGIVICANIAPYEEDRIFNKNLIEEYGTYIQILMDTSLSTCEKRDVKGLYKLAKNGKIKNFTGIDDPFEPSQQNDIILSEKLSKSEMLHKILNN